MIVGGGFGGVKTALELSRKLSSKKANITLIDRNNYHLFLPSLYELASAYIVKTDPYQLKLRKTVSIPYEDIFKDTGVKVVQAQVEKIDLAKKEVITGGDAVFSYDHLVLGFGVETDTFGIPGAMEYTYKFKGIDEALFLNQRMLELYKKAANGRHSLPIKFIVAGAGFNGIELAGELAGCAENIKNACGLHHGCIDIQLIEAGPQILPMINDKERQIIRRRLEKIGIKILESSPIKEVGPNFVKIGEGGEKIFTDFIVWTGGVRASSFLQNITGLKLDAKGKVVVNPSLQAEGREEVWALGDNTVFLDPATQKPIPGLASVAIDQGAVIAENIKRIVLGEKKLETYHPEYGIWVAPVGGKFAVAHLNKSLTISGVPGWIIRQLVNLKYFLGILPVSRALSLMAEETEIFIKND